MESPLERFSQLFDTPQTPGAEAAGPTSSQMQIPQKSLSECLHVFIPEESMTKKKRKGETTQKVSTLMEKLADAIEKDPTRHKDLAEKVMRASDFEAQSFRQRARISAIATGEHYGTSFFKELRKSFLRWTAGENVNEQKLYDEVQKYRKDFYEADGTLKSLEEIKKKEPFSLTLPPEGGDSKTHKKIEDTSRALFEAMKAEATKRESPGGQTPAGQQSTPSTLQPAPLSAPAPSSALAAGGTSSVAGGSGGALPEAKKGQSVHTAAGLPPPVPPSTQPVAPELSALDQKYTGWTKEQIDGGKVKYTRIFPDGKKLVHIYQGDALCTFQSLNEIFGKGNVTVRRGGIQAPSGQGPSSFSFKIIADWCQVSVDAIAFAFLRGENVISEETLKEIFSKGSEQGGIDPSLLAYVVNAFGIFQKQELTPLLVAYLNKQSVAYNQEFWLFFQKSQDGKIQAIANLMLEISNKQYVQDVVLPSFLGQFQSSWEIFLKELLGTRDFSKLFSELTESSLHYLIRDLRSSDNQEKYTTITNPTEVAFRPKEAMAGSGQQKVLDPKGLTEQAPAAAATAAPAAQVAQVAGEQQAQSVEAALQQIDISSYGLGQALGAILSGEEQIQGFPEANAELKQEIEKLENTFASELERFDLTWHGRISLQRKIFQDSRFLSLMAKEGFLVEMLRRQTLKQKGKDICEGNTLEAIVCYGLRDALPSYLLSVPPNDPKAPKQWMPQSQGGQDWGTSLDTIQLALAHVDEGQLQVPSLELVQGAKKAIEGFVKFVRASEKAQDSLEQLCEKKDSEKIISALHTVLKGVSFEEMKGKILTADLSEMYPYETTSACEHFQEFLQEEKKPFRYALICHFFDPRHILGAIHAQTHQQDYKESGSLNVESIGWKFLQKIFSESPNLSDFEDTIGLKRLLLGAVTVFQSCYPEKVQELKAALQS